ncbi:ATP-binding protein [Paraflavisolibacter sp. H34]|uniref:sensor histidine kinase n=1 Tax=Huijunlia imazamoxiresistens TaxID=3127457 RepID=UPI00301A084A
MNEVLDFFRKLFDTSDWPPRWHCGEWTGFHGWLYILSDLLIWSAYFAIPLIILRFITRRADARFVRAYFLFAAFILACGSTHLLDAVSFWFPAYRLNALVRLATGVVSWVTVFYSIKILPVAMSLKSHAELEKEIAERKKAGEDLTVMIRQLNEAQDIARIGHWQWDVLQNKLTWSDSLFKVYGFPPSDKPMSYDDFISRVYPADRNFVNEAIEEAFATREFPSYVHRIVLDDGSVKVIQAKGEVVVNEAGEVVRMIGTGQDITEQHLARQQLLDKTQELESANIELKKFAYIASHDLQEPLRKIMTFASMLEAEAPNGLPGKMGVHIEKIVGSSLRMQRLIGDILRFSNLKHTGEEFAPVALNDVLDQVQGDLELQLEEHGARVVHDDLPVIEAIPSQMGQLFQNLLSNALKFRRKEEAPLIHIQARLVTGQELLQHPEFERYIRGLSANHRSWTKERFVLVTVRDNGIGFEQVYAHKIFEVFQRLQADQTAGTGIGLAICKKIVDNHYGLIAADGHPGEGAVFTVILPVSQKNFIKG